MDNRATVGLRRRKIGFPALLGKGHEPGKTKCVAGHDGLNLHVAVPDWVFEYGINRKHISRTDLRSTTGVERPSSRELAGDLHNAGFFPGEPLIKVQHERHGRLERIMQAGGVLGPGNLDYTVVTGNGPGA